MASLINYSNGIQILDPAPTGPGGQGLNNNFKAIGDALDTKATAAALTTHASRTDNPHGVTPGQIGAATATHGHTIANVTGLQTALDGKAATSHTHTIANVTNLQASLDGKAPTSHTHAVGDVSGLQSALDNKSNVGHGHEGITNGLGYLAIQFESANAYASANLNVENQLSASSLQINTLATVGKLRVGNDTTIGSAAGDITYENGHFYGHDGMQPLQLDGGGGNPFNQNLNTSDSVTFQRVRLNADTLQGGNAGDIVFDGSHYYGYDGWNWQQLDGGSGGSPGGNYNTIQYNNSGSFAGDDNLTWDSYNRRLDINGPANVATDSLMGNQAGDIWYDPYSAHFYGYSNSYGTVQLDASGGGSGVSSWNGQTGDISYSAPVNSVNGMQGDVVISTAADPAGTVKMFAGSSAPSGYLPCDGQYYYQYSYPDLFAVIGYTYGQSGDYFAVPDLRGRFPVGAGTSPNTGTTYNLSQAGGEETHTLTTDEMPSHAHGYYQTNSMGSSFQSGSDYGINEVSGNSTDSAGGNMPHENRPPYLALNFIIKY